MSSLNLNVLSAEITCNRNSINLNQDVHENHKEIISADVNNLFQENHFQPTVNEKVRGFIAFQLYVKVSRKVFIRENRVCPGKKFIIQSLSSKSHGQFLRSLVREGIYDKLHHEIPLVYHPLVSFYE